MYRAPKTDPFGTFITLTVLNGVTTLLTSLTVMIVLLGLSLSMNMTDESPTSAKAMVVSASLWLYVCLSYVQRKILQAIREWLVHEKKENVGGQG